MPVSINPNNAKVQIDSTVDTLIHLLIDGSYSMRKIKQQTLSGIKEYVGSLPPSTPSSRTLIAVTVFQVGGILGGLELNTIRPYIDINDFTEITDEEYSPDHGTPLLDAIKATVMETDAVARTSPTPPAVLFVIATDGEENSSRDIPKLAAELKKKPSELIKEMIEAKTSEDKWTVIYLGANQDSFAEAASYGIAKGNAMNFVATAASQAFTTAATASTSYLNTNRMMRSVDKTARYSSPEAFSEANIDNTKTVGDDKK